MTRNLKALGLTLLAVSALGAIGAQTASAADEHQFKFDGQAVLTGSNVGAHEFTIGAVGTVKCTTAKFESTVSGGTEVDQITVKPTYENCEFGTQPATVFINDCAYVLDSDTLEGNPDGGKYANIEIECAQNISIKIHTVNCTITIAKQLVLVPGVRYTTDTATRFVMDAHFFKYTVTKERTTPSQPRNGCLPFPTGAVGGYTGTVTSECRKDEGESQANPTTPSGTKDSTSTECSVTGI